MSDVECAVDFRDYRDVDGVRWPAASRASGDARRHEPEGLTKDQTHGSPGRADRHADADLARAQ